MLQHKITTEATILISKAGITHSITPIAIMRIRDRDEIRLEFDFPRVFRWRPFVGVIRIVYVEYFLIGV